MKTISLRLDEQLLEETEQISQGISFTRNRYINEAVKQYNKLNRERTLQRQLPQESLMIRKESMKILHEFEILEDEN
jgi:metal-responsive CopG/Arc/MetJ family transcriptional regulator